MSDPCKSSHFLGRPSTSPEHIPDHNIPRFLRPEYGWDSPNPAPPAETLVHPQSQTRVCRKTPSIPFTPISTNPVQHDPGDSHWSFLSLGEGSSMVVDRSHYQHPFGQQRQAGGNDTWINDSRMLDHQPEKLSSFHSFDLVAHTLLPASSPPTATERSPCCILPIEDDGLQRQSIHSLDTFIPVSSGTADVYQDAARCREPAGFNFVGVSMRPTRGVNHLPYPATSIICRAGEEESEFEDSESSSSSSSRGSPAATARHHTSRLRGFTRGNVRPSSSQRMVPSSQTPLRTEVSIGPDIPNEYPDLEHPFHFSIGPPLRQSTPFQGDQGRVKSPVPIPQSETGRVCLPTDIHPPRIENRYDSSFTNRQQREIDEVNFLITECLGAVKRMAAFIGSCSPADMRPISRACGTVRDRLRSFRPRLQDALDYGHWAIASPSYQEKHIDRLLSINRNITNLKDMAHKIMRRPPHINKIQKIIDKLEEYDKKFSDLKNKMKLSLYDLEVKRLHTHLKTNHNQARAERENEMARHQESKRRLRSQKALLGQAKEELRRARKMLAACREDDAPAA